MGFWGFLFSPVWDWGNSPWLGTITTWEWKSTQSAQEGNGTTTHHPPTHWGVGIKEGGSSPPVACPAHLEWGKGNNHSPNPPLPTGMSPPGKGHLSSWGHHPGPPLALITILMGECLPRECLGHPPLNCLGNGHVTLWGSSPN